MELARLCDERSRSAERQYQGPGRARRAYYLPWLLSQLKQHEQTTGQRLIDVFSVHLYGPAGSDTSIATQLLRNRSTRSLWDKNYVDEGWINQAVQMIPRLKAWVASCYPGLQTAITEYNWAPRIISTAHRAG